jgi:hypothetical protein
MARVKRAAVSNETSDGAVDGGRGGYHPGDD